MNKQTQIDILRIKLEETIKELTRTLVVLRNLQEELDEDKELNV